MKFVKNIGPTICSQVLAKVDFGLKIRVSAGWIKRADVLFIKPKPV
ncbi:MAG: hypothetical protein ACYTDW_17360 [Planctomycetota bacterium]